MSATMLEAPAASGRWAGRNLQRYYGKRALLLGRVSTKIQEADGYSLDAQRDGTRGIARLAHMVVVGEDFEQGSGQDWDLASIHRVIQQAKRHEFAVLVLKNVSRLSRKRGKQAWLEHLLGEAGILILYYDEDYEDSAAGRLQRGIMAEIAEFQLEQARELSMEARYLKVSKFGRPVGNGQTPYGWRRVYDDSGIRRRTVGYEHDVCWDGCEWAEKGEAHWHEADVLRRFRDLLYLPTQAFVDRLNADGIPGPGKWRPSEKRPRTGKWTESAVWHLLRNRMTWGEYRYGERMLVKKGGKSRVVPKPDAEVYVLQFPPILTRNEVKAIRSAISSRSSGPRRWARGTDNDPFFLRDILRCGHCGGKLSARSCGKRDPYRFYWCIRNIKTYADRAGVPVCPNPQLIAFRSPIRGKTPGIEDIAWEIVKDTILDPEKVRAAIRQTREGAGSIQAHRERLAFLRKRIQNKTEALNLASQRWAEAEDEFDRESFGATREALKRELTALKSELADLDSQVPTGVNEDEEAAILDIMALLRKGSDRARSADKAFILQRLQVRGTVWHDPEGPYHIGRQRYRIEWTGALDLSKSAEKIVNGSRYFVNFEALGRDLAVAPLEARDGYLALPTTPGLGIELNEQALEAHRYANFPPRTIRRPEDEGP